MEQSNNQRQRRKFKFDEASDQLINILQNGDGIIVTDRGVRVIIVEKSALFTNNHGYPSKFQHFSLFSVCAACRRTVHVVQRISSFWDAVVVKNFVL